MWGCCGMLGRLKEEEGEELLLMMEAKTRWSPSSSSTSSSSSLSSSSSWWWKNMMQPPCNVFLYFSPTYVLDVIWSTQIVHVYNIRNRGIGEEGTPLKHHLNRPSHSQLAELSCGHHYRHHHRYQHQHQHQHHRGGRKIWCNPDARFSSILVLLMSLRSSDKHKLYNIRNWGIGDGRHSLKYHLNKVNVKSKKRNARRQQMLSMYVCTVVQVNMLNKSTISWNTNPLSPQKKNIYHFP